MAENSDSENNFETKETIAAGSNIAELFIRRPVMTTLVMLAILFFGFVSYRILPVSDLPNVDFPTIVVSARLPGANPDTMASAVATPLERQFSTIAGLDSMNSTNALGVTQITLQFDLNRDIDAAAQDVQASITKAIPQLPQDMPAPPSYQKVNPADQPILFLALSSATLPLSAVHEYAETVIAERVSMVSGVAQVQVFGGQKYAVRAQLDPTALASKGIGVDEVASAIQRGNVNLPTGTLWGAKQAFTIKATGQLNEAASYAPMIVAYRNGVPVRLREIGRAIDSVENDKVASWHNDERAIILTVQRQPGTNTAQVVDAIKKLFPAFEAQIPASVNLHVLYDRSISIKESVRDVKFTLFLALCLVVLVIFLFLRNISSTFIPSMALPMSVVGTFCIMYLLDYSLDNLSLMALTLSVGFVVDDAIVMLENIVRHREKGEDVFEASLKGSREISFTILSMTVSLVAVFIPVLFMGGLIGRLLQEFAVTIAVSVLVSGFISLSLTPMLCSRFLKSRETTKRSRIYELSERFFNGMLNFYDRTLKAAIKHHAVTFTVSVVIFILTVYLFVIIPKGFFPPEDTGVIFGFTEATQGISFDSMAEHQRKMANLVKTDPNVDSYMSSIGVGGMTTAANSGRIFVYLKKRDERKLTPDEVIQELRKKVADVPGLRVFFQNLPTIRFGGQITKSQYQFTLQSPDTEELYHFAPILEDKMRAFPDLQDVTSDLQLKNPQVNVIIDRDKASSLGISARQVEDALYYSYGSRQVSTILASSNQYQVIMELLPEYQTDPSVLSMLYVRSSTGKLIPLDAVARLTRSTGPLTINHLGQLPSVTLSFNLKPGASLGPAIEEVRKLADKTIPPDISTSFQGAAGAFQSSLSGFWILIFMAILVIYIVLGILYESFIHPLTILSGLPSAGFGALLTLLVFGIDLNIYAFVGIIMLIGIVKKNAIMMIDFALDAERKEGKTAQEAIYQGCLIRFRPIMMTTMAALMASFPIALGFGAGGESRRPLGLAVVGGLLFSQLITLYITPVIYVYLDNFQKRISGRFYIFRGKDYMR